MMLIDEDTGMKPGTPWHVWWVGALATLWNAGGAWNYIAVQTRALAMSEPVRTFYDEMPLWAEAAWTVAIWASVAGSVLILARSRYAAPCFLASLAAMAISFFHNIALANGAEIAGGAGYLAFTALIVVIAIGLYLYARWLKGWADKRAAPNAA
ncbi:MAG: hypothetical protein AAGH87_03105 [Pseudomonadota bacterium]